MESKVLVLVLVLVLKSKANPSSSENDNSQRVIHNHFYLNGESDSNFQQNAGTLCSAKPKLMVGPPGKRGPIGQKGASGPPGRDADGSSLNAVMEEIGNLKGEIAEIKAEMEHSNPGLTLVSHNSEGNFFVSNCEPGGCYSRNIVYEKSLSEIRALIAKSKFCRQFMKYQCHGSILYANHNKSPDRRAWWLSGSGTRINKFAGAKTDYTCPCHDQGTCVSGWKCNCDRNDGVWRSDEGYVTDKDLLPVTQLRFGDIGEATEMGIHTLGKLECYS